MKRNSPFKLMEARIIRVDLTPDDAAIEDQLIVTVQQNTDVTMVKVRQDRDVITVDLDQWRVIARSVERCLAAHYKRNSKAKKGPPDA